jgi:hypothetical protein
VYTERAHPVEMISKVSLGGLLDLFLTVNEFDARYDFGFKITRALNDAVPFSNNGRQQRLFVTGTVGLLPPLQFRILASSRANAFCNHRRAEARIPEKGRDCSTPTDRRRYLRFPRSQRVKEREAPENVEARLVTSNGFLGHTLQYG